MVTIGCVTLTLWVCLESVTHSQTMVHNMTEHCQRPVATKEHPAAARLLPNIVPRNTCPMVRSSGAKSCRPIQSS